MKSTVDFFDEPKSVRIENNWSLRTFAGVGRLHITAIAALGLFTFGWLFTGKYPWLLMAVCSLDWTIVNLINRIVDLREDRANSIDGTGFVYQNRKILLIFSLTFLVFSLVGIHLLNPAITILRIGAHLLGIFYNWPLLPGKRRLKQLYFWKNSASGIGFLITVFGYPLVSALGSGGNHRFPPGITWPTVVFSALFFFLFIQSYEILYDLRDIKGDTLSKIRTYPVVHGEQTAIHIIDSLIFASIIMLALGYWLAVVPWRIFIMIAAPFIQLFCYKVALRRRALIAGCIRITWMGAVLFLIYHIWILADLPGAGL